MNDLLPVYQKSLESLISANRKIREIEGVILEMNKKRDTSTQDRSTRVTLLLDEIQLLIEDVDLRTNHLDVQLSAIERLMSSQE